MVAPGGAKIRPSGKDEGFEVSKADGGPRRTEMRQCTMRILAGIIANRLDEPVADETGLKGAYDFSLALESNDGASYAAAIRAIALRLERRIVPVPQITVKSAALPDDN